VIGGSIAEPNAAATESSGYAQRPFEISESPPKLIAGPRQFRLKGIARGARKLHPDGRSRVGAQVFDTNIAGRHETLPLALGAFLPADLKTIERSIELRDSN